MKKFCHQRNVGVSDEIKMINQRILTPGTDGELRRVDEKMLNSAQFALVTEGVLL